MPEAAASSKADDGKKAEKEPVDNATLAFMLRESADIVEKGEFDVILYHALQDFRTYYKFHLPKHKAKAKKKQPNLATESDTTTSAATSSVEKTAANSEDNASSSLDAKKEAGSQPAETPAESASADPQSQSTPEEEQSGNAAASAKREVSEGSPAISEGTTSTATSATTPSENPADPPTSARVPQAEDEPESVAQIDVEAARMGSTDSILSSERNVTEELFNNESGGRGGGGDHEKFRHSFATPLGKKVGAATKGAASKISAGVFATGGKIGKKLTKIHLPTSGKKKKEQSTAGLTNLTGGDVAQYAESSKRRPAVGNEEQQQQQQYDHYHHQNEDTMTTNLHHNHQSSPPRRNSANLQPAVTGLGKPTEPLPSTATTLRDEATPTTIPVDRVRDEHYFSNSEQSEQPSSLRGNENNTHNAAANDRHNNEEPPQVAPASSVPSHESTSASSEAFVSDPKPESFEYEMPELGHSKPTFQRPKKNNSAVVANGWVEQHRRSKMRTVWKEVLASLVRGRLPGEETTLWIQRETINPTTDKKELEVLHQIPVKLLEGVVYPFTTDDRFSLKLYNSQEDFVFRCNQDPSAAMNWVTILQQYEMETKKNGTNVGAMAAPSESIFPDLPEEKMGVDTNGRARSPTPTRLAIRDLRAICHGAGINTAGMERADLERAAAEVEQRGTYFAPPGASHAAAAGGGGGGSNATSRSASPQPGAAEPSAPPANTETRTNIKDLRAICHGAGISTVGMERGELERAATEVQKRGTYFAPPAGAPPVDESAKEEGMRRRQATEDEARRRAAEEEHWRRHEEESRRRAAEEEHRRREEEHRRRAEEEHRRRAAEDEHRRRIAEQQAAEQRHRYAKQQAAWHHQQQQDEQRRRMAEQQATEQRRRHEEAMRNQQQWAGQQQAKQQTWTRHPPQQPDPRHQQQRQQQQYQQQAHSQQWQQHQQWHQQQQQHQRSTQARHPQQHYQKPQQRPQAPPPQQQQQQHAPPPRQQESKYAKMANQSDDDGQAAITKLKHDILIQWALQPPQMQMLRSVDVLLSTIQNVFPPALGVPAHDYFKKWKVVTRESVLSDAGIIDGEKIKKAVRKLRFFLHPDKLPKDLNSEQQFTVKMLWDITNDALEEYQKSKEDLDWIG